MSQEIHIRASVPEAIEGDVLGALIRLSGVITNIEHEGDSRTAISSTIPKKHIGEFKDWLQTFSNGRGSFAEDNT